ncbi:MAG: DEAD/DEAH box helicase [Chitinophagales bacterium]
MSFKNLGLSDPILKAVAKKAYTKPSVIQEKAIPLVLEGKDVLASAQTGTGKTAGFVLPILDLLAKKPIQKRRPVRSLILTPTRELAAQIYDNILDYSKFLDIRTTVIFGGVKQHSQVAALNKGVDILVATPGRLLDLCNQKILNLSQVEIFVLDEADRMLDMGFIRDIKKIMSFVPEKRQTLLFSATFSKEIKKLSHSYLSNPATVEAAPENTTADKIKQKIIRTDKSKKTALIIQIIKEENWKQGLVFTRTKHGANKLCKKMMNQGISASAIHGNKTQNARVRALSDFKAGKVKILVATDIAARGLDIPLLPHVCNFELPNIAEDYVHRIGRTGRAGASGEAISLVSSDEMEYVESIEKLLGIKLKMEQIEGYEPSAETPENELPKPKKQHKPRRPKQNRFGKPNQKKNALRNDRTSDSSSESRSKSKPTSKSDSKPRRANKVLDDSNLKKSFKKKNTNSSSSVSKFKKNNGDKEPMAW